MYTRALRVAKVGLLTIRPLRNGDTAAVEALFAKSDLPDAELAKLATVDDRSHTIVAYLDGDPEPAGVARLVRDRRCRTRAEIAFAVADHHGPRLGPALVECLAEDARAAGITATRVTNAGRRDPEPRRPARLPETLSARACRP
jgi:hypothetical protein